MASERANAVAGKLADKLVVLFGGTGYFGANVAQELLKRGARLRIVSRHPEQAWKLKPLANLGQLQFVRADLTQTASLPAIVAGAHAVVNLVGAFTGDLDTLHVKAPAALAAAAKDAGVEALVHISANGANAHSPVDYARTKAEAEVAVLAAFPAATILRPSVIFGPDDKFINLFAGLISALPVLPVFGPEAKFQPVFIDDAAAAVANALSDPGKLGGKTFELVGPEVYTMAQLNRKIAAAQGRTRLFVDLPDAVGGLIAALTGWLPGAPLSRDQFALLTAGNISSGLPGLKALGVAAHPLELFLDRWMLRYRNHGRFGDKRDPAG